MALTEIGARLRLANAAGFKRDADRSAAGLSKMAREAGQANREVSALGRNGQRAGKLLGGMAKAAAFGVVGLGVGAIAVLGDSVTKAGDLAETMSKVNNVFGEGAKDITVWSRSAARSFGLSQQEALAAAGQYGDMFKQLGFTETAAVANSKALVKMSADLGSFHNVDPTDVLDRIGASLRGEFDSLQQLIPNINAARVEQAALAATGKKTAKQLTAQEKAAATLAIITRDGALANNDFAETSGGLANQQRILSAQFDDVKASLGQGLLPVATRLTTWLNDEAIPDVMRFIDQFERGVGPGGDFRDTMEGIGVKLRDAWPHVKNVADKTMTFVKFLADNPDVVKTAAVGIAAYATAMKAAALYTGLVALRAPIAAAGIGKVGAASTVAAGSSATGLLGFGAALRGVSLPALAALMGYLAIKKEGSTADDANIIAGAPTATIGRAPRPGTITFEGKNYPQYDKGNANGDSNRQPLGANIRARSGASVAPASAPSAAGSAYNGPSTLVAPIYLNSRMVGEAVIDDLETRAARR